LLTRHRLLAGLRARTPRLRALRTPRLQALPTPRPLRTPRAAVVKRLAVVIISGGVLAVAAASPVHPASTPATTAAAVAPAGSLGDRTGRVSRGAARTPVQDTTPASAATGAAGQAAAPTQTAPTQAAPSPAAPTQAAPPQAAPTPATPTQPAVPVIDGLDPDQAENAQTIVQVGRDMGVSTRGKVIAVATALQESRLYNLTVAVDHDSLGLFQQRPSAGWGTPDQLTTPAYAARAFYARLLDTQDDWDCLTCAAQRVQGSAFPDAYAQHEVFAVGIVNALGG
jgi:hypothetical protein